MVLVGRQPDRAGLDAQRNVLADQRDVLAFGGEIGRAGQYSRIVAVGPKARGQHGRVAVIEFDVQRAALGANGNRLIQPTVLEAEIVEQSQCLAGEPAQLVMMAFSLQFADDNQRDDHFVLGEPSTGPWVRQQYGRVEHVGPGGGIGHVALLEPARPRTNLSADTAAPGPGPALSSRVDRYRPDSRACR